MSLSDNIAITVVVLVVFAASFAIVSLDNLYVQIAAIIVVMLVLGNIVVWWINRKS